MAGLLPRTVRGRVILLIVLAFLPSVGLFWYAHGELKTLSEEATEQQLLRMAEVTAADFERMVEEGRTMLEALALHEEVKSAARPVCDDLLGRVLAAAPRYTSLQVIDAEGYRRCGAVSLENPLYLGDRSYFVRASANRGFAVGDYQVGRITGIANVGLALPMYDDEDRLLGVLASTLDLRVLAEHGSEAQLPSDASHTLSDLSGNILARYPGGDEWVGEALPPDFPVPDDPAATETVVVEAVDLDGAERRFAIVPLVRPGGRAVGYLAVGVQRAGLTAGVDRVFRTGISLLVLAAAFLLFAAWALGHFSILARSSAIMAAERKLAAGDFTARTEIDYGDDEIGRLARTFDEMASALQAREEAGAV